MTLAAHSTHPSFRRAAARGDPAAAVLVTVTLALCVAIMIPVLGILWMSLHVGGLGGTAARATLANFTALFADPVTWHILANTIEFAAWALAIAFVFGLPIAWLAARTDLPARPVVFALMAAALLNPGFILAMGWLFLLHPRVGIVNRWLMQGLGLDVAPLDVTTIAGMGWVQGLALVPLAFNMIAAALNAMDPALEDAASVCRAGRLATIRRVTLRLAWPGLLAAAIFIFMIGFAAFDVPAIIGWGNRIFTFSTYSVSLIAASGGPPQYGPAAALAAPVMAIAAALGWFYTRMQAEARKYAIVTGKGYRPHLIPLGRWRWAAWLFIALYAMFALVLPVLLLLWSSLLPYLQPPSALAFKLLTTANFRRLPWMLVRQAATDTGALMLIVPSATIALSVVSSWVVLRTTLRCRGVIDFILFLPHVVPNIVFGIAVLLIVLFAVDRVVPIYGTIWVLAAVFVVGRISYGTRMTNAGLIQLHPELSESARIAGAATAATLWRVVVPLLAPTLIYSWMWIALLCYRELTLAVVLTTAGNLTLPVLIWDSWSGGDSGLAAAIAVVMLGAMMPLVALYYALAERRRDPMAAPSSRVTASRRRSRPDGAASGEP